MMKRRQMHLKLFIKALQTKHGLQEAIFGNGMWRKDITAILILIIHRKISPQKKLLKIGIVTKAYS